ncbi:hypothetical protein SKAU_G00423280 [Synaphobranchus kaupii]|uniref:Pyrin domain-containing protein n=1 Tax=Synaphobranchus kaupii TaxID=118154 RepID=A0A9Q1E5E3_SYNKA|nr:hypothetical protein SKAU_G00423280 [Synaphobranchus kaupii]
MKLKKDEKLKLFQSHLSQYYPECSVREQEDPEALYIVEKMLKTCGSERSLKITLHILRNMKQKDLTASLERDEQHTSGIGCPNLANTMTWSGSTKLTHYIWERCHC